MESSKFLFKSNVKISDILFSFDLSDVILLFISILLDEAFSLKLPASKIKSERVMFSEKGKIPGLFTSPEISI